MVELLTTGRMMTRTARSETVVKGPMSEFLIRVERAPRLELFMGTPSRWWNLITGNKSWWLTVYRSEVAWPVLREKFDSLDEANFRAQRLAERLKAGWEELGMAAARRRVKR